MTGINILNGHSVLPGIAKAEAAHIHIENGVIASVGKAAPIAEQLDASGLDCCTRDHRSGRLQNR